MLFRSTETNRNLYGGGIIQIPPDRRGTDDGGYLYKGDEGSEKDERCRIKYVVRNEHHGNTIGISTYRNGHGALRMKTETSQELL